MTEQEINNQLNDEYDKFLYEKYSGKVSVPLNILELFKTAIVYIPSFAHKITYTKVKAISTTQVGKLTNTDLNDIVKVVLNTPMRELYPDLSFEKITEKGIEMDKFVVSYNASVEDFKQKLNQKKEVLKNLSSGILGNNGMRIIPHGKA